MILGLPAVTRQAQIWHVYVLAAERDDLRTVTAACSPGPSTCPSKPGWQRSCTRQPRAVSSPIPTTACWPRTGSASAIRCSACPRDRYTEPLSARLLRDPAFEMPDARRPSAVTAGASIWVPRLHGVPGMVGRGSPGTHVVEVRRECRMGQHGAPARRDHRPHRGVIAGRRDPMSGPRCCESWFIGCGRQRAGMS